MLLPLLFCSSIIDGSETMWIVMRHPWNISLDDETRLELTFLAIVDIPAVGCRPSGLNGPTQPKLNKLCGLQPMFAKDWWLTNNVHTHTHIYIYIYSAKAERTLLQLQPMFAKDETRLELIFPTIVDIPAIGCRPRGLNGPTQPKMNELWSLQPMFANNWWLRNNGDYSYRKKNE